MKMGLASALAYLTPSEFRHTQRPPPSDSLVQTDFQTKSHMSRLLSHRLIMDLVAKDIFSLKGFRMKTPEEVALP